tara:strand:- start:3102 stop:3275 length:174 start_codon:yes stop_codon:yes gene_type:complete
LKYLLPLKVLKIGFAVSFAVSVPQNAVSVPFDSKDLKVYCIKKADKCFGLLSAFRYE